MSKKTKQAMVKILVSFVLFSIIASRINLSTVGENFKLLDSGFIPVLVLLLVLNYAVSSVRWKVLLIHKNTEKVSIPYLTSLYFQGSFFNNFMPTSIGGDVYKVVALGKKIGDRADAFASTFMERFTGMIALVLISYFGLIQTMDFWILRLPTDISTNPNLVLLFQGILFFGFWILAAVGFTSLKILSKKIEFLKRFYDSLLLYKGKNKILVNAFITSFIVQFLAIFTQYLVFYSMGVQLPMEYALFIFPVITLASFFIPSLNGLGVQDALYMQLFLAVGVGVELSLSASIIYHLLRLFVSLFGGVLYVMGKND